MVTDEPDVYYINHSVKKIVFQSVFCMNVPSDIDLNIENVDNGTIKLYVFTEESSKFNMNVSDMIVSGSDKNIAEHFLTIVSERLYDSSDYKQCVKDHCKLEREIHRNCSNKWVSDLQEFESSNEICLNADEESICSFFMKEMIHLCPARFDGVVYDVVTELPFKRGDYVSYTYTCQYKNIRVPYVIRVFVA
jgi:hypothetical protein